MDYLEIILKGYFNENSREHLENYFFREFKKAEKEHYSDDEFFSGCLKIIEFFERNLFEQMHKRKRELYFMLNGAKTHTILIGGSDNSKSYEQKCAETIENCRQELDTLSKNNFKVQLSSFTGGRLIYNMGYNEVLYVKKSINEASVSVMKESLSDPIVVQPKQEKKQTPEEVQELLLKQEDMQRIADLKKLKLKFDILKGYSEKLKFWDQYFWDEKGFFHFYPSYFFNEIDTEEERLNPKNYMTIFPNNPEETKLFNTWLFNHIQTDKQTSYCNFENLKQTYLLNVKNNPLPIEYTVQEINTIIKQRDQEKAFYEKRSDIFFYGYYWGYQSVVNSKLTYLQMNADDFSRIALSYVKGHADAHYLGFLEKRLVELKQGEIIKHTHLYPVNEFEFLDKLVSDINEELLLSKTYNEKFKTGYYIFEGKHKINQDRFTFYSDTFRDEIHRVKSAIKNHALRLKQDELIVYVNQLYPQIMALIARSRERFDYYDDLDRKNKNYNEHNFIHSPDWRLRALYTAHLNTFQYSFIKDFKPFLDFDLVFNTDEKKFEHYILSNYNVQHDEIEKHKNHDCNIRKNAIEEAAKLYDQLTDEYIERYDYLVSKWIKSAKQRGNETTNRDFINYQSKRINDLFKYDKESETYIAKDYKKTIYAFNEDFYNQYVKRTFDFIKDYLERQINELNVNTPSNGTSDSKIKGNGRENSLTILKKKRKEKIINTFEYNDWGKNAPAISTLYKSMNKVWIKDTSYKDNFKRIFSNEMPANKIIWLKDKGLLKYFIRKMKKEKKITGSKIWIAANNSFIIHDEPNYDIKEIAHAQIPKGKKSKQLLIAINTLVSSM